MGIKKRSGKRKLSVLEDYDQDGVPNFDDCQPLDPTQHGMTDAQRRKLAQRKLYHPVHHRPVTTGGKYTYHVPTKPSTKRKVVSPRPAATRIIPTRIEKPKKVTSVPKLHGRKLSIVEMGIDVVQDIGRDITTKLGQLGTDIQRQVPKVQRPLQKTILFGGFIGKGERVGRLAVAPTPQRVGLSRVDVLPVVEAKRIGVPSIVTAPVSMLKKGVGVAITPFGLAPAVSDVHRKLTSMYKGIAPPLEQRLYEQQFREMETGVSAFETKWEPYVKEERFVGSEEQHKQMLKEHTALEAQQSIILQEYSKVGEPLSAKAERKLAGYWTAPIYTATERNIEKYTKWLHREMGWSKPLPETPGVRQFVGTGKYVAEHFPSMVISPLAMMPPAFEAIYREPKVMASAVIPGLAFMGKGMVEESVKDPLGFAATMILGGAITKGVGRISPIKYTGPIKIPTGKEIYKTKYTIGAKIPKELETALSMDTGKLLLQEQIGMLPLSKVTYKIPEALTYRGLYGVRPSGVPYKGIQPLIGEVSPARLGIPEVSIGVPKLTFKPYLPATGIEHAVLRPSIIRQLEPVEAKAFVAIEDIMARYHKLEALAPHPFFAGVKRLKAGERDPILAWMREHPEQKTVLGGSAAIRAETVMGRVGKDIDIYVKSTDTAMRDLNVLMQQEGAKTRVRGTTIERIDEGRWHHAIDIHERLHEQLGLGFETKPTIKLPVEYGEPIPVGIGAYLRYEQKIGRLFSVKPSKTLIEEQQAWGTYAAGAKHLGAIKWSPKLQYMPLIRLKKMSRLERLSTEMGGYEKVLEQIEKDYKAGYGEKMVIPRGFSVEAIVKQQIFPSKKEVLTHEALHHEYPFLTEPQVKGLEIQAGLRGLPESVFVKRKVAYLEAIPLGEHLIRKGISIMKPRGKGKIGPQEWRMKDIEDFLSISKELYRSSHPSRIPGLKQLHIREIKALEKDIRAIEEWKGTPTEHVSEFLGIEEAKIFDVTAPLSMDITPAYPRIPTTKEYHTPTYAQPYIMRPMAAPTILMPLYPYVAKPYKQPRVKKVVYPIYDIGIDYTTRIAGGYPPYKPPKVPSYPPTITTPYFPPTIVPPTTYPPPETLPYKPPLIVPYPPTTPPPFSFPPAEVPPYEPPIVPPVMPLFSSIIQPPYEPPITPPHIVTPPPYKSPFYREKKKKRKYRRKYRFEEYPWKERHYIPTLQELMKLPKGVTIKPPKAFAISEMKMPKMPKGLM